MIVLDFSHPLTQEQVHRLEDLAGQPVAEVRHIAVHFEPGQPFASQVRALADACHLSPADWQTQPLLVVPPSLNFIAVTLLAELHGRTGYFPSVVRLRLVAGSTPARYEVAEVINLQAVRDAARAQRAA